MNGTVGFVLQQVDREVRTFADHAFAHSVHERRSCHSERSRGADSFDDHFHLSTFMEHEEVARLDQLLATVRDVQHMDRLAGLRPFRGEDDQAIGGCRSVHRREETVTDGCYLSVVGLHRAVRQVLLQAVDDDAFPGPRAGIGLQVIAEVRAEVAVDEDDASGVERKAIWKCDGRITLGRGVRLAEQLGHAGVFPGFGPGGRNGQRVRQGECFRGVGPGGAFEQGEHGGLGVYCSC